MSEGSKMGLFGSKEEKQESTTSTSEETTATPNSPNRYAPYCIDSDSETYDTEALSIMDINDIIGVQTGQAAESTLESEIAALSEIMTDSRGEGHPDKTNQTFDGSLDVKFNKKLTELNAASSKSKESIGEQSIATEKSVHPLAEGNETECKPKGQVPVEAGDAASCLVKGNVELEDKKAESAPENENRDEPLRAVAAESIENVEEKESSGKIDNAPESKSSEVENVSDAIHRAKTESLEGPSEDVSTKSDNVSVQDPVDTDSVVEKNPAGKESTVLDPDDDKSNTVLANVCSIANSLQLIGEAYISEDSQETNDRDESLPTNVASLSLQPVEEVKTINQDMEPHVEATSETETRIDDSKTSVAADMLENAVVECNLDHQDNTPLDDNKEPDNTNEVLPNLKNDKGDGTQDSTSESVVNVRSEDEKAVDDDKNAGEREELAEMTMVPKDTKMEDLIEKAKEPLQEIQELEETVPNTGTEAHVLETLNAEISEGERNQNPEELTEGTCQEARVSEIKAAETDDKMSEASACDTPMEVDNSGNIEPLEELENSSDPSLDNRIVIDSVIPIDSTKVSEAVEPAGPIDEQSMATSAESNNENESMDSKISDKSASSLQRLNAEDTSESSTSRVEMMKSFENEDNKLTTATIPAEENSGGILDDVEQLSEIMRVATEQYIVDDVVKEEEDIPTVTEIPDVKKHEEKDEHTSIHKMIESIRKQEAKMESESNEMRGVSESQFVCMKSTSSMVIETGIDSSNDMPTNEEDTTIEQSQGKIEVIQDLTAELGQSASTSSMENDESSFNLMKLDKPDRRKLLEKFSEVDESNYAEAVADSRSSEVVEDNLDLQKDDYMERAGLSEPESSQSQVQIEVPSTLQIEAPKAEFVSNVKSEEASNSTTDSPGNIELESFEVTEPNLPDDKLNRDEITEKSTEREEIDESEKIDSKTPTESRNLGNYKDGVSKTESSDGIKESEENESMSEPLADTEIKQAEDSFDKDDEKLEEKQAIAHLEAADEVSENMAASKDIECNSDANATQIEQDRGSEIHLEDDEDDSKMIGSLVDPDDQQEPCNQIPSAEKSDNVQYQGCSDDAKMDSVPELSSDTTVDEKEGDFDVQLEKLEEKADLVAEPDESLRVVMDDASVEEGVRTEGEHDTNLPEIFTCRDEIGVKEPPQIESEPASGDAPKSLETREEIQEDNLISTKPLDEKNLDDTSNVYSSEVNVESSQTPSGITERGKHSEDTVNFKLDAVPLALQSDNLMELDMKMDKDLQSEPIRGLEELAEGVEETLIDEITNSVLKEVTEPLESISSLKVLPDSLLPTSIIASSEGPKEADVFSEIKIQPELLLQEINEASLIEDLNETPSVSHGASYLTDIITSPTNIEAIQLSDNVVHMDDEGVIADDSEHRDQKEVVRAGEILTKENITEISEACKLDIDQELVLDKDIRIDSPVKVEDKLIASAVLDACDEKIDLPDEVLFNTADEEETDVLCTPADNLDTSQQSSEFSELECAVKFLQESEEQTIDSPLLLSPKIAEGIVEEDSEPSKSCLFLSETEVGQGTLELRAELEEITPDSIAISEAEIISEAAKLENERKLKLAAEMSKTLDDVDKVAEVEENVSPKNSEMLKSLLTTTDVPSWRKEKLEESTTSTPEMSVIPLSLRRSEKVIRSSEKIPKTSILEERLKEPPKIEIPVPEVSPRMSDTQTTPKTSLLMQRDSRADNKSMYQKMLDSPKGSDRSEPKIMDTPRKGDSEKHDFENVGSPRIILKIAKSAITDCGEPRSPKSPKIRSAANSPNPEDSPGQKLGKIKLKLSRGGHPSIISNENFDETAQRHTEAIPSPSHIGMKIKLSKSGDASIIQPDKHESNDEAKESKHKYDDVSPKRIESPLGMKIKLSKTGDPSIVQQESSQESSSKRKDKLDIGQEVPKRTDSPIGVKIKLSKSGDASIIQPEKQDTSEDKFDNVMEIPKRTESPIGMKIKLSKSGDASIISSENSEDFKESSSKSRDKLNPNQDIPKRTDSPLGMKFKLSKSGGASIIQPEKPEAFDEFKERSENMAEITKRVESPIGMKIKLSKTGDASIIHPDKQESNDHREAIVMKHRDKSEVQDIYKRTDSPIGMRIKMTKSGEASVVSSEELKESSSLNIENYDTTHDRPKRNESPIGMKIKLSKSGDASIIHPEKQEFYDERGGFPEGSRSSESPLGMKIKLSRTGDASIIQREASPDSREGGYKRTDSPLGMKIKLSKTGDASIIEPDKKDKSATKQKEKSTEGSQKRKDSEFPLEMKIKLSKTGHPTIIANEKQESLAELHSKSKDHSESSHHKRTESLFHSTIIQSNRSDVTIEPIQMYQKPENSTDIPQKSKDVLISPVDVKKSKVEAKLSHMLPEVTIQPVMSGEQKQISLDKKSTSISRQQMSVINQEISITQVPLSKPADLSMSGKLKEILRKNATNSPASSDCEIIEHRPELIIVNENSNSSQDIMIIEEVKAPPVQEIKVPRKRGRPKRSSLPPGQTLLRPVVPQDPLALDNVQGTAEHRESDRPKRTCRSQKSYAPPKRGRGRGRGKRKMDRLECAIGKIPRLEDPLTAIERSTMSLIAPLQPRMMPEATVQSSELYKALNQSPADRKRMVSETVVAHAFPDGHKKLRLEAEASVSSAVSKVEEHSMPRSTIVDAPDSKAVTISEMLQLSGPVPNQHELQKIAEAPKPDNQEAKNIIANLSTTTEHQNWLTPSIKLPESTAKTEAISMVQVMDEETRMSAESNSRSQTPARNISIPVVETAVINEESQGSVLSTATTESEKVKVRNRRMEINFDPDEGPFTVDKIAEYEWPPDKKGDTFMIQEQISQYLGVKSFKRKYPDLKRRMVEMEERNYLRENCLVSEAMCDMGLTAICSPEVLDIMCSDFPDQYEEYRKHMREKQAKEHSKKQKELTAAANAERNRIDLAEMAVQSALSWNVNFNKARKESRKYSLDLQSFTIHQPKKQQKVDPERKASNYPVALIPGQYTDYYREYTPAELRYYPLNTVLYGPMRPNERKFDSQSEGSQSDSDSDSSSDDSSSSSSEGTQDTEESQSTVDDVDMELAAHKEDNKNLKCKMCLKHLNKHGKAEVLIQCGTCNGNVHPSCIDLTLDMVPHIQGYSWQCTDCKTCVQCHNPADEDKMLFCDMCDRGYHIYCVGLRRVPQGRWHCRECAVCASCGLRQPGGANSDRNSVAQWQHEYKKGERNTRVYVSTLCVPCSKLWRKGRYCPHCSRCHSAQRLDLEPSLIHCGACDKYLHLGCVEIKYGSIDRKNYICECCSTPNISRSLISKNYKT